MSWSLRPFDGPGETVRVVNVRISSLARGLLLERIEALVREYSAQHNADAALPLDQRYPMSLLVAARGWEPDFMRRLRRITPGASVSACSTTGPAGLRNRQPDFQSPAATRSLPAPP